MYLVIFLIVQVEQAKREGRFTGTVVGPIGMYLKIAPGKEVLAPLAEFSLGFGVLDRFIVTNNRDRSYFMKLRNEMRCSPRDCGVYQMVSSVLKVVEWRC